MDALLESFITETQDILDELEDAILSLENSSDKEVVDRIFRAVHTIKGNSGLFDVANITELSHKFENVLGKIRAGELESKPFMIDIFLSTIDLLRRMVSDIERTSEYDISDLTGRLGAILEGGGEEAAGGPPIERPVRSAEPASASTSVSAAPEPTPAKPAVASATKTSPGDERTEIASQSDYPIRLNSFTARLLEELDELEDELVGIESDFEALETGAIYNRLIDYYFNAADLGLENMKSLSLHLASAMSMLEQGKLEPGGDLVDLFLLGTDRIRAIAADGSRDGDTDISDLMKQFHKLAEFHLLENPERPVSMVAPRTPSQSTPRTEPVQDENKSYKVSRKHVEQAQAARRFLLLFRIRMTIEEGRSRKIQEIFRELGAEVLDLNTDDSRDDALEYQALVLADGDADSLLDRLRPRPIFASTLHRPEPAPQPALAATAKKPEPVAPIPGPAAAKKPAPASAPPPAPEPKKETHLKVPIELIDQVINLAGETIVARNELVQRIDTVREPALITSGKKISFLITRLQEGIMRTRMQQLNVVFGKIPRIIRDLERGTGKKIELVIEGGDVDLDKTTIDIINDPIMHMVRNSVDHGIESGEERLAAGKPRAGRLRVQALLRGGNVILNIQDDGKGLNLEAIRAKAIERGLITEEQAERMEDEQIGNLIFEAGFSTAATVTTISGRGVGMDVVRSNINRAGGNVQVSSTPGQGTRITATLPQTLTIITCLIVRTAGRRFALPQQNIDRLVKVQRERLAMVENRRMYKLQDYFVPVYHLREALELVGEDEINADTGYIAIVRSEHHHYGLIIDEIMNPEEIVIKPLGKYFLDLGWYSGAAIMGDGEAVLILDVPGMARGLNIQKRAQLEAREERMAAAAGGLNRSYVLFELHGQRFAVSAARKPRIHRIRADSVKHMVGFDVLHVDQVIAPILYLNRYFRFKKDREASVDFALLFERDEHLLGIGASSIVNVIHEMPELDTEKFRKDFIQGTAIIEDRNTLVLHGEKLLDDLLADFKNYSEKAGAV